VNLTAKGRSLIFPLILYGYLPDVPKFPSYLGAQDGSGLSAIPIVYAVRGATRQWRKRVAAEQYSVIRTKKRLIKSGIRILDDIGCYDNDDIW